MKDFENASFMGLDLVPKRLEKQSQAELNRRYRQEMKGSVYCVLCGREGHNSSKCKWGNK